MFGGQIFKKVSVQAILSTLACLVWYWNGMVKKLGGRGKLIAKKIKFFFCARIVLFARAKFLRQPLITFKTFVFDRFSRLLQIENGPAPPHAVLDTFVLARMEF